MNEFFKNANNNHTIPNNQQLANLSDVAAIGNMGSSDVNANNAYQVHGNHNVENHLLEKFDSLDLDIDSSELLRDLSLANILGMMDSGNNITLNSSGNINMESSSMQANTPHDNRA